MLLSRALFISMLQLIVLMMYDNCLSVCRAVTELEGPHPYKAASFHSRATTAPPGESFPGNGKRWYHVLHVSTQRSTRLLLLHSMWAINCFSLTTHQIDPFNVCQEDEKELPSVWGLHSCHHTLVHGWMHICSLSVCHTLALQRATVISYPKDMLVLCESPPLPRHVFSPPLALALSLSRSNPQTQSPQHLVLLSGTTPGTIVCCFSENGQRV